MTPKVRARKKGEKKPCFLYLLESRLEIDKDGVKEYISFSKIEKIEFVDGIEDFPFISNQNSGFRTIKIFFLNGKEEIFTILDSSFAHLFVSLFKGDISYEEAINKYFSEQKNKKVFFFFIGSIIFIFILSEFFPDIFYSLLRVIGV